jgi:hypothetical protein
MFSRRHTLVRLLISLAMDSRAGASFRRNFLKMLPMGTRNRPGRVVGANIDHAAAPMLNVF